MDNKGNDGGVSRGFSKGQNNRNQLKNQPRFKPPSQPRFKEQSGKIDSEGRARPPMQCWGCGCLHYVNNYPHRKGTKQVSQIHEGSTISDMARSIPKINVGLEDHHAEYQRTMVEFEAKILDHTVSVLIDPGATLSYVSPKVVEQCKLQTVEFKNPWLVQLATRPKRHVLGKVHNYPLKIVG